MRNTCQRFIPLHCVLNYTDSDYILKTYFISNILLAFALNKTIFSHFLNGKKGIFMRNVKKRIALKAF